MKKVVFFLLAALAIVPTSCKKGGPGGDDDPTVIPTPTYRVTAIVKDHSAEDLWDGDAWKFEWNEDGTIKKIDLDWAKETYSSIVFTYNGNKVTAVDAAKENKPVYEITLNAQKLAILTKNVGGSDYGSFELLECTYDKNGFLTIAKVNEKINSMQSIDENGDIEFWTRIGVADQVDENITAPGWRKKMHTYYSTVNAANVHIEWNEDCNTKRWLYESGLLGRASAHITRTAWWYGVVKDGEVKPEYAEKLAYYPLVVDENGCVIEETKLYDTKEKYEQDPSQMKVDSKTMTYFVEKIK